MDKLVIWKVKSLIKNKANITKNIKLNIFYYIILKIKKEKVVVLCQTE